MARLDCLVYGLANQGRFGGLASVFEFLGLRATLLTPDSALRPLERQRYPIAASVAAISAGRESLPTAKPLAVSTHSLDASRFAAARRRSVSQHSFFFGG